jgi:hypothetical protein
VREGWVVNWLSTASKMALTGVGLALIFINCQDFWKEGGKKKKKERGNMIDVSN